MDVKSLNRAVKRNIERFPKFFMFQLTDEETKNLRYQFGTAKINPKSHYNPYVFTEQGIAMLSSVFNSKKAIQVSFIEYARDMNINIEYIYRQLNYLTDRTKPNKIGFNIK